MGLWDIYARFYDSLPKYYGPYQRLLADVVRIIDDGIPQGGKILDAGCGTGSFSIELGRLGYDVEGIDSSEIMLMRARQKSKNAGLKNVEFKEWDIEKGITFHDDGTLDCVISVHTLYSLVRPELAISEYVRILKPGGLLILAEPQHPIRITSIIKEAYSNGGLYNLSKLVYTQFGIAFFNMLIRSRLRKGVYHCWNQEQMRKMLESSLARIDIMAPSYAADADLLTVAVKPSFHFESNGYRFMTAETTEDIENVYKLRHQVYCVELGFEPQNDSGLETDEYDEYAMHFLAIDQDNQPIGTLRAVEENPLGFPMDNDFP
ncbi:MAG: methyltransferase domain-containing protein [Dehalococcoidia bacterium]|nr:MAG: methyltransferase domain-containing protein [Dehalococcoidia bacterium]